MHDNKSTKNIYTYHHFVNSKYRIFLTASRT